MMEEMMENELEVQLDALPCAPPTPPSAQQQRLQDPRAFLLHNLLTESERLAMLDLTNTHKMQHTSKLGYQTKYRNNTRLCVHSDELAGRLFARIRPFLPDELVVVDDRDHCMAQGLQYQFGNAGKWVPERLNPKFRLCCYEPGGHFSPHFDGARMEDADHRSFLTFMLYLNTDFADGHTRFLRAPDDGGGYDGEHVLDRLQVAEEVPLVAGSAIVFPHHILHDGQPVKDGRKAILRTDVMFRRVEREDKSEQELEAIQLVREAEQLEAVGRGADAVAKYKRAFRLCPQLEGLC